MSLLLQRLSRDFMREIGEKSRSVYELLLPPVDMFEDGSDLVIMLDMPGFDKDKIRTRLSGENTLVVTAKRDPTEHDGPTYWEQRPLSIRKRIPLPVKVEYEEEGEEGKGGNSTASAKYENGVLTVRLPIKGVGKIKVQ
jgi:HSP20 family protein